MLNGCKVTIFLYFCTIGPQLFGRHILFSVQPFRKLIMLSLIPLFLGGLRGSEIIIIALVILLLFGGRKIPELMRGLGKGVKSFRQGMKEVNDEINSGSSDEVSAKNSSEKR